MGMEEGPSATAQHHIKIAWFIVSFEAPLGPESEPELHERGGEEEDVMWYRSIYVI